MIDLTEALARVVTALDRRRSTYVVVGSVAAARWGVVRGTRDVDLVVLATTPDAHGIIDELDADDELYVPAEFARSEVPGGSFNVYHPATGGKVDLFVAPSDDAFTRSRIERRVRAEVLGVSCWVASPEDVVLAKLKWRLESRSEQQWRDCVEVAATQELDEAYMRRWAPELDVVEDLEDLLEAVRSA